MKEEGTLPPHPESPETNMGAFPSDADPGPGTSVFLFTFESNNLHFFSF